MKGNFFFAATILLTLSAKAQYYEHIKNQAMLMQYSKAKEELDKSMTNEKFTSKPEAYILKTIVYAGLAMDDKTKGTPEGRKLIGEADIAFRKYKAMDPSMILISDVYYQNGLINVYSGFYLAGYDDYTAKKWESAYGNITKAKEYSDLLIEKKILNTQLDTNVVILTGIIAENSNHPNEAAKAYSRLADHKIKGEGFESVYRYLVSYHFMRKDYAAFEKYKAYGRELYPNSEFFTFDRVDFAVGLATNFQQKVKAVEEVLATEPNNYKANEVLGEIIYDTLNPRDNNIPPPSNAADLEKKMLAAFKKAATAKPGNENPYLYMGDHFINKAVAVDTERTNFSKEMKTRTQPGSVSSNEDLTKKEALDKKYGDALELAREPYEKAAGIYAGRSPLTPADKKQYKKAVSYLTDIFAFKKIMAKNKNEDATKYAELEKKWNDVWVSIK